MEHRRAGRSCSCSDSSTPACSLQGLRHRHVGDARRRSWSGARSAFSSRSASALAAGLHLPRRIGWRELLVVALATSAVSRSRCSSRPACSRPGRCCPRSRSARSRSVAGALLAFAAARSLTRRPTCATGTEEGRGDGVSSQIRTGSVASEIRRIVSANSSSPRRNCETVGDPESDEAVHDARRRVKKIRAVIRLVRPVLDKPYRASIAICADVSRLLAPVADGQGIIDTLDRAAHRYRKQLLPQDRGRARSRSDLLDARHAHRSQAASDRVPAGAPKTLRRRAQARQAAGGCAPTASARSRRASRTASAGPATAMMPAWSHPTGDHYHTLAPSREGPLVSRPAARRPLRQPSARRTSAGSRRSTACSASTTTSSCSSEVLVSATAGGAVTRIARMPAASSTLPAAAAPPRASARHANLQREARTASCGASSSCGGRASDRSLRRPAR